jgi:DNA-binding transcriptional MerR regulator
MTTASYAQIVELLGDVDDLYVKRIEETGASLDEISEALADVEELDEQGASAVALRSPRCAAVRSILEEMLEEPDDEIDGHVAQGA